MDGHRVRRDEPFWVPGGDDPAEPQPAPSATPVGGARRTPVGEVYDVDADTDAGATDVTPDDRPGGGDPALRPVAVDEPGWQDDEEDDLPAVLVERPAAASEPAEPGEAGTPWWEAETGPPQHEQDVPDQDGPVQDGREPDGREPDGREPDEAWVTDGDEAPDDSPAVVGEGWVLDSGDTPEAVAWIDADTSTVPPAEMTGIWLRTELGRGSPLRMDGEPIEPEDLDVSTELIDRLRDYSDLWHREWDAGRGWRPRARIGDYEALGLWLARRVKDAVGATDVTYEPAHLGRSGARRVDVAAQREPEVVLLMNEAGARMPVWGDFVTDSGVGSFSSELNLRLEAWAEQFERALAAPEGFADPGAGATHEAQARALAAEMQAELGPDYRVELDLWEVEA